MEALWRERKRWWCGVPWTFTVYSLDEERLHIESGFLNQRSDEVRLYRIMDIALTRTLSQRIFGLGTVHLSSSDKTLGNFALVNIKRPKELKELLSSLIEKQRDKKRVSTREFISSNEADDLDGDEPDMEA